MGQPRKDPAAPPAQLEVFARRLRKVREDAGLSQDALARLSGVNQSSISLIERSQREPGLLTVVALARALQMRPAELIKPLR